MVLNHPPLNAWYLTPGLASYLTWSLICTHMRKERLDYCNIAICIDQICSVLHRLCPSWRLLPRVGLSLNREVWGRAGLDTAAWAGLDTITNQGRSIRRCANPAMRGMYEYCELRQTLHGGSAESDLAMHSECQGGGVGGVREGQCGV